jgi:hypothetical protein
MDDESPAQLAYRRSRQKFTIFGLAGFLVLAGLLLIFVLKRVPLPMRIVGGLGDLVAGLVLVTLARQKFSGKS